MTTIVIDGVIGWDVSSADVRQAIRQAAGDDLVIEINSPGGFVTEGIAIYNAIRNAPGAKTSRITGLAASMGSYIALAADRVVAEANAIYMVHNASMFAGGDHNALRKAADIAEGMSKILMKAYIAKTGKDEAAVKAWMDDETFFYGDEILDAGFADEIAGATDKSSKSTAVMQTRAAVASAEDLIKRLTTEQDTTQAAACLKDVINTAVGSAQAAGPKIKEVNNMTEEQIAALKAESYQAGMLAERKRISDLTAWKGLGSDTDKLVEESIANGKTYEEVSAKLHAAAARNKLVAADGENAQDVSAGVTANASGAEEVDAITQEAVAMFGLTLEDAKRYTKK